MLSDEIARATARLAAAGIPSPRADAEELAAFVHGVKRAELHGVPDAAFDARFWEGIARREAGEPLQHITGRAFFRYLELRVGPGVFVPRPETEVVAGWAIDTLRTMDVGDPLVVDLGTGSGAIALSIAQEVPRARVHAVEKDPKAYVRRPPATSTSSTNAGRVRLHLGDFGEDRPLRDLDGTVDLVVSNPPYIPMSEWEYVRRTCATSTRRPRCGAVATTASTRSAWSSVRRGGCCAPAAGRPSSTATCREPRLLGLRRRARLARHAQPQGPDRPRPLRHRTPRHRLDRLRGPVRETPRRWKNDRREPKP